MKNGIGKGVAVTSIWVGVSIASFSPIVVGNGTTVLAVAASLATYVVVLLF